MTHPQLIEMLIGTSHGYNCDPRITKTRTQARFTLATLASAKLHCEHISMIKNFHDHIFPSDNKSEQCKSRKEFYSTRPIYYST